MSFDDPLALEAQDAAWVERTLAGLSVQERISQLFILSTGEDTSAEAAAVSRHNPGGVHRFPGADLDRSLQATREMLDAAKVPLILSGDIEGGAVSYPFATPVPNQLGIAACDDLDLSYEIADIVARESRALGYDWSLTPVVDLNHAFRNPVVGTRSFGSDVETVLAQARAHIRAMHAHDLVATAKHWPGDGYDERDQHMVTTVNPLSLEAWDQSFGRIYRALIDDGLMAVMSAHIAFPAFVRALWPDAGREAYAPASVSHLLNQVLLREQLGFRGIIVSDATVMGGLTSWMDRAEAVPAVIENGCDVFLFSRDAASDMALMLDGLRTGRLSEARLDEAARRMLTLKARLGLHRKSSAERIAPTELVRAQLRQPASLAVAEKAAGLSLTLVKDRQELLPLDPARHRRVTVIADAGGSFVSGAPERSFEPLLAELHARGFIMRTYDADQPPTRADTDLVVYLIGQDAMAGVGVIQLDFAALHGSARKAMMQFNREIPTLLVSFGQPYYLYDAPNFSTCVNAYCPLADNQRELARRLVGELPFTGRSPVDPFCGLEQLRW